MPDLLFLYACAAFALAGWAVSQLTAAGTYRAQRQLIQSLTSDLKEAHNKLLSHSFEQFRQLELLRKPKPKPEPEPEPERGPFEDEHGRHLEDDFQLLDPDEQARHRSHA